MSNEVMSETYSLAVLAGRLAVCRLGADAPFPVWARWNGLFSLTRTADELSIVCDEGSVPEGITAERGWRALKVQGSLEFSMVGVLARLAGVLAAAGVSIFVVSTYNTDYLLVKVEKLETAVRVLGEAGHRISGETNQQIANRQADS